MTTNRPRTRGVPLAPWLDVGVMTRITTDLMARSSRLWVDLWFANLDRASATFWSRARRP